MKEKKAVLALESGDCYFGLSFGAETEKLGEVVFNTSLTGYQEILSDPSYKGQIIVFTEPHIGNVGTNLEDRESEKIFAEGVVVREISSIPSNWRSKFSLQEFLIKRKVPGISGVDTRAIVRKIREKGAMRGILSASDFNPKSLMKKIQTSPQMLGRELVREVTCKKPYEWNEPEWQWKDKSLEFSELRLAAKDKGQKTKETLISQRSTLNAQLKVVVMDFGVKQNILRCLVERDCSVTVVPARTSDEEILSLKPNGILLSNGPGDPSAVTYAIETIKKLIDLPLTTHRSPLPIFGICLGHQLLGLAFGGKTFKLKYGHRGANHPVKDLATGKIEITTQNHGFCVDMDSLKDQEIELTHINLNDGTLEGLRHKKLPIFSVQYHPESSAGPQDSRYLFDRFIELMNIKRLSNID